jgi:hypothetical protein
MPFVSVWVLKRERLDEHPMYNHLLEKEKRKGTLFSEENYDFSSPI